MLDFLFKPGRIDESNNQRQQILDALENQKIELNATIATITQIKKNTDELIMSVQLAEQSLQDSRDNDPDI